MRNPRPAPSPGQITFSFQFIVESNRTYAVESRASLSSGSWSALTNVPAQPADTAISILDAFAATNRYNRVRTP